MFLEKKRLAISSKPFTANGTAQGLVTVANTSGLYTKQKVKVSNSSSSFFLEIKRFVSDTQFFVGPIGGADLRQDLSSFVLATLPAIEAAEQDREPIRPDDFERAVYAEEPVVAKRVIAVDENGNYYNSNNPFPVDASVSIGDVLIETNGYDTNAPDSINITGSENGAETGLKHGFVYNKRQQVLAAHDRVETYTYADFGTKNQRIIRVDYTSATFPGLIVRREFNYVLDGNKYRRTDSPWTII